MRRLRWPSLWSIAAATAASIFALSPSGAGLWKPSLYSSAMKPVESLPARQRGCAISAVRNGMLWRMPSIAKASSASRLRVDRGLARRRVRDELGDHRVVPDRDLAALVDAGVVAHRDAVLLLLRRRPIGREPPGRGQEVARRVLGIDAALDRPAGELHVALLELELLARRDADHLLDEVDAGDELGHRMLDLQPRVHLEEVEAACPARRRTRPCRRSRSRRPWRARPPARPSSGASPHRAAATAPPR